jgi:hypothetical protein
LSNTSSLSTSPASSSAELFPDFIPRAPTFAPLADDGGSIMATRWSRRTRSIGSLREILRRRSDPALSLASTVVPPRERTPGLASQLAI